MNESNRCEQCGGEVPVTGALVGQCPRCLLEAGLDTIETAIAFGGSLGTRYLPSSIGRYSVTRMIGQGGMGAVYEAEQDQPRRTVALKIIRPGMTSPELLRRFEQETQALGRLHHPGIAQIYDAGTADAGFGPQPYFAMEYVRGRSLTTFAEERQLDARARLELMAKVCDAVQHAHQRGLIHRDLKPGNILVDDSGQPKILDFGVARLTDQDTQTTAQTNAGQLIGTVAYMSPEQVLADPLEIDTRSDVYTLGVILYELLSGQLPYRVDKNLHEALSSIRDADPARLSVLNKDYRGDVETIVAKAMEKDKARRYASVAELGSDIRRYLTDEPIMAHPPDLRYQLKKFALRRKSMLQGVAAVFVFLLVGASIATYQVVKHQREAEQARIERDKAVRTERALGMSRQSEIENFAAAFWAALLSGSGNNPNMTVREALDSYVASFEKKFAGQPQYEASMRESFADSYLALGLKEEAGKHRALAETLRQTEKKPIVAAPSVQTPQQAVWSITGSPGTSRGAGQRLVLLKNGKVLSLGGVAASADLYDPASGEWSVTGSMSRERSRPIAVRLENGKVLTAGGTGDTSAEIYDPGTETWSTTGSLSIGRSTAAGVLLKDGRVLITGGSASPTAELYDPASGTWRPAGTMTAKRSGGTDRPDAKYHTSTLLLDGRVLVVGGDNDGMGSAELFDPATGKWTATAPLITPRFNHTATLLPNGKVLVAGGGRVFSRCPVLDDAELAEIFDPATGKWSAAASMKTPRAGHAATLLENGKLLIAGVAGNSSCYGLASSELYDPAADRWTSIGSLKIAAIPLQAVRLENGQVLVVGGNGSGAELFDSRKMR